MINSLIMTSLQSTIEVFVCAMDDEVVLHFKNYPNVNVINLKLIEAKYPKLKIAKSNRSYVEYLFTLSPFLPLYVLEEYNFVNRITSLDSDLFFINDVSNTILDLGENIAITEHNFSFNNKHLIIYGNYNVSFQSFPRTEESFLCLRDWCDDCFSYCYDKIDEFGRFADQKYLDNWHGKFFKLTALKSPAIGLAPWNVDNFNIERIGEKIIANGETVIFFHFHGFRIRSKFHAAHYLNHYSNKFDKSLLFLYFKYWKAISMISKGLDNNLIRNNFNSKGAIKQLILDFRNSPVLFQFMRIKVHLDLRKLVNYFFN